ncbi:hypothetical protein L1987_52181 [Smallanthus sonchifolius]|uniref:Uncharacterized protein n=1 Tax=Smallanthus sonchifolius TaxID=185202 RepID=A0ACB9ES36_9ASTR|nr:hypothetical protein L1987_52181 [Smallanthus sonchifolius]
MRWRYHQNSSRFSDNDVLEFVKKRFYKWSEILEYKGIPKQQIRDYMCDIVDIQGAAILRKILGDSGGGE